MNHMHETAGGSLHSNGTIRVSAIVTAGALLAGGALLASCTANHAEPQPRPDAAFFQKEYVVEGEADVLAGQWKYMPGLSDDFVVQDLDRKIVQQDGSGGQENPPINMYGTRLSVSGGFRIDAKLDNVVGAELGFYGKLPIIQDEFRLERQNVRTKILPDNRLEVSLWDGSEPKDLANQKPAITEVFPFASAGSVALGMQRQNGELSFEVNGKPVGSVPEKGVFDSKQVWFGADAHATKKTDGRWKLQELKVSEMGKESQISLVDTSTTTVRKSDSQAMQRLAEAKRSDFTLGSAASLGPAVSDPAYAQVVFGGNLKQITFENASKAQNSEPKQGVFVFEEMDALADMARRHQMTVNLHAVGAFGEALPKWMQDLPTGTENDRLHSKQALLNHTRMILEHYNKSTDLKKVVDNVDFINEPLAPYETFAPDEGKTLRQHKYFEVMGKEYIKELAKVVHDTLPTADTFLNDWGMEMDDERWRAMLAIAKDLKKENIPLTGIGFQAHVYDFAEDEIDPQVLAQRMRDLQDLNLEGKVSELDVIKDDDPHRQARQFASVIRACFEAPNCKRASFWGMMKSYDMYQAQASDGTYRLETGDDFPYGETTKKTEAVKELDKVFKQ